MGRPCKRSKSKAEVTEAPAQAEKIVGDQELARRYGVTTKTVYAWRQAGLPFERDGRATIYDAAKADEWVELHRRQNESGLTPAGKVKLQREEEKLRQDRLKADELQRDADAAVGNVLRRDEWELFAVEVVQQARDRFMRLPITLCKHVPQKYHRVLRTEGEADVRKICEEMARTLAQGPKD